jgi:hypothetical protein
VQALIEAGCDVNAEVKDGSGDTALHLAARSEHFARQEVPPDGGCEWMNGDREGLDLNDTRIETFGFAWKEALALAEKFEDEEKWAGGTAARWKARMDACERSGHRYPPPHPDNGRLICQYKTVLVLLDAGADPFKCNEAGLTPLGVSEAQVEEWNEPLLRKPYSVTPADCEGEMDGGGGSSRMWRLHRRRVINTLREAAGAAGAGAVMKPTKSARATGRSARHSGH